MIRRPVTVLAFMASAALVLAAPDVIAQAQKSPFGIGDAARDGPAATGVVAWLLAKQAELTRAMTAALRAANSGAGLAALCTLAFTYGVLHAAGPGHGKAVVSSYVFANEQTLRRGVGIAVAAAFVQALVAIMLVVPAVVLIGATARQIDASVRWVELLAYSGIALLGLSLVWRKGRVLFAASKTAPHVHGPACRHGLHAPGHVHGPECSHVHIPDAAALAGRRSWQDMAAAVLAAGARPCSGAIILLAFALSSGSAAAGILAVFAMAVGTALTTAGFAAGAVFARSVVTRLADGGERMGRVGLVLEFVAACLVSVLGFALLAGFASTG
ncbi:MAG: nickel transporter [Proteobacteria bacterium]|nr:nickel transporter [Pseudomonadota bacterium]